MSKKEIEGEKNSQNKEEKVSKPVVYEVGYLFVPTVSEEEVGALYGNLKDLVSNTGGNVIADEMPKMINLAYEMLKVVQNVRSKFNTAYFGWIKFEMDSQDVLELKKKLDLDPLVLRFLILKTVKENTIATKRFVFKDAPRKKAPTTKKEEGEVVEINKEEIDKEIDAMVSV